MNVGTNSRNFCEAPVSSRQSQTTEQMGYLNDNLASLHGIISDMECRLATVMRDCGEPDSSCNPREMLVQHAENIRNAQEGVSNAVARIANILNRLEL